MDDPWGNAWSSTSSNHDTEDPKKPIADIPKWNTFERDADDNTVDVGVPSWSGTSDVGWTGSSSNLWHAESSTLDGWSVNTASHALQEDEEAASEPEAPEDEENKDSAPRPILPTPPQSPLPPPSPPPVLPPVDETPPSSPQGVLAVPGSPDPFGSFESAEVLDEEVDEPSSWAPKTPTFPPEVADEPWGGGWGGGDGTETDDDEDENDQALKDEWQIAQEVNRRRERKVPAELLGSLITQWDELVKEIFLDVKSNDSGSHSWRRGLDNVEGLTDLVDSILPVSSLPPAVQFPKTAIAKAVKESLRLTRSYQLTQSSPKAHLYASKGSNDWERSIKAQKAAANDEWGWDLKHEPDDKPEVTDSSKEKKAGGLLSFWGRKSSSNPVTPIGDPSAPSQPKSPTAPTAALTVSSKPTSPAASARSSIDILAGAAPSRVTSPTATTAPAGVPTSEVESVTGDGPMAQPSAVSRFFNRFSRKPSAPAATSDKDNRSSLAFSANDLSLLSDMVPSTSEDSVSSHRGTDSTSSLEAMLSSPVPRGRYSSGSSSKLPAPLAPPPPPSSRPTGPLSGASYTSDSVFDAQISEAQLMDVLMNMGPSSGGGYAPVSFDLIDSPAESNPPPWLLRSPTLPSPFQPPPSLSPKLQPHIAGESQRPSRLSTPSLSSTLPPPLPPPIAPSSTSPRTNLQRSSILASTTPPPLPPPQPSGDMSRRSSTIQRFDNPLPPTPQRDLDDFSEFFSAPAHPQPPRHPQAVPSSSSVLSPTTPHYLSPTADQYLFTPTTREGNSADLGDFGDFMSTPLRSPSPPKVPRKTSRAANHKPTMELVESAAAKPGRWPAPPSPLPQLLAPPPGGGQGFFTLQQRQHDLLSDESPTKPPPTSGTFPGPPLLPPPPFAGPPSRPSSTSFPAFPAPPPPPSSTSRPSTPLASPPPTGAPPKAPAKSGLSAQDLSFFEGL